MTVLLINLAVDVIAQKEMILVGGFTVLAKATGECVFKI